MRAFPIVLRVFALPTSRENSWQLVLTSPTKLHSNTRTKNSLGQMLSHLPLWPHQNKALLAITESLLFPTLGTRTRALYRTHVPFELSNSLRVLSLVPLSKLMIIYHTCVGLLFGVKGIRAAVLWQPCRPSVLEGKLAMVGIFKMRGVMIIYTISFIWLTWLYYLSSKSYS